MAEVYDRWYKRDPGTGLKIRSAEYGCKSRWQVRWRDDTRSQKKQNFVKRAQADARRAEIEDTLNKGTYVDPIAGKRKFRDYVKEWLATLTTDPATRIATTRRVKLHILPTFGDMELRAIRPSTVQAWLRGLSDELAATYVRVLYAHFTAIMSAAVDDGLILRSPCAAKSVKPPAPERRRIIPWTAERVATVTAELPERYRVVVVLASGLGLRIGECLGVGVDDIDFLHRVVHVRRQVKKVGTLWVFAPPKGGKERDVPLPEQVALRLAAHLQSYPAATVTLPWRDRDARPESARLIVTTPAGGAVTQNFHLLVWNPALKAAGAPTGRDHGPHALRHYFASVLLDAGVSIIALAEYLGHHDPAFTLRTYTHLMPSSEGRMRAAVDAGFTASALDVPQGTTDTP